MAKTIEWLFPVLASLWKVTQTTNRHSQVSDPQQCLLQKMFSNSCSGVFCRFVFVLAVESISLVPFFWLFATVNGMAPGTFWRSLSWGFKENPLFARNSSNYAGHVLFWNKTHRFTNRNWSQRASYPGRACLHLCFHPLWWCLLGLCTHVGSDLRSGKMLTSNQSLPASGVVTVDILIRCWLLKPQTRQ